MLRTRLILPVVMFLVAAVLPACGLLPGSNKIPTAVQPTLVPFFTPSPVAPTPTSAMIPTATPPEAETIPASPATAPSVPTAIPAKPMTAPIVVVVTATPSLPTPQGDGSCSYKASFLADLTIPDNTTVPAGTGFTKTWSIRNDGTCTWGTSGFGLHSLVLVSGDQLSAPSPVPLPTGQVPPGATVDISVPMVAPTTVGSYTSNWMLQVDNGPRIGVGPNGGSPLYARIIVGAPPIGTGMTRILFEPGATNASVQGNLPGGQFQEYVLGALAGQTMMLDLSSSSENASMTVRGAQGINPQVLRSSQTSWLGILPANEDYIIRVDAGSAPANFSMNVTIPQRIVFDPGAISKTVTGTTNERRTVTYLLRASAGQTMNAVLSAPGDIMGLTIYGLDDGQPLVRKESGATSWTGQLPGTQDYVIQASPAVDGPVNFTLQTTVQ